MLIEGSAGVFGNDSAHFVELFFHIFHQFELGAAAPQILISVTDMEIIVAIQVVC